MYASHTVCLKRLALGLVVGMGVSLNAQAGFLDALNQVSQVASAVSGASQATQSSSATQAAAQLAQAQADQARAARLAYAQQGLQGQPTVQQAAEQQVLAQAYAGMDCAGLNSIQTSLQSQLAEANTAVQGNDVQKTANTIKQASGLIGSLGSAFGVNTSALTKVAQVSMEADKVSSLAANPAAQQQAAANVASLNQQLQMIGTFKQAKACQ